MGDLAKLINFLLGTNALPQSLWFGRKHPDMQLFLNEFVTEVNSMVGVKWNHNGDTHISRPHVLCISVDAPARAAVQNMVSFNGYFGCTWCLNPGEHREGSLRYTVVSPIMMRTSDQVKSEMRLASQFKDTINGLKGPSALMNLKGLDLVNGYSVEYMHCVLLGVAKQITETILATSNSHQRFYSGSPSALSQIDARLLSIKPPHCITRLPRSIQERSYWKASEWRHWLLFYSLPCLSGILIEEYWRHLSKLSGGVYILLKDELTAQEIDKAEFLLKKFVSRCEALYGASFMTYNVHALLHLASCARSLGPLWAHAAFVFEGGNGTILGRGAGRDLNLLAALWKGLSREPLQSSCCDVHLQCCFLERQFVKSLEMIAVTDQTMQLVVLKHF
ncbi:uncharacterized protein LOC125756850 [Rhipicephalus sanguineus]|uniref:uncharacterized protein LOC125756850 n=1 Tax=Rhipicephalus sanguineus TaxID=34632 RepID=UPI0020C4AF3D|nr:uncharacterized protein LOC125756850 [Rhipicephalus sanguineus]